MIGIGTIIFLGILSNVLLILRTFDKIYPKASPAFRRRFDQVVPAMACSALMLPFVVGITFMLVSWRSASKYQIQRCYEEILGDQNQ